MARPVYEDDIQLIPVALALVFRVGAVLGRKVPQVLVQLGKGLIVLEHPAGATHERQWRRGVLHVRRSA